MENSLKKALSLFLEAVAKLLRPRKSMILAPVLRTSKLVRVAQTRPCPDGQARLRGEKWRQKGDFMGRMSFAIASLACPAFMLAFVEEPESSSGVTFESPNSQTQLIRAPDKSVINCKKFNVGKGETVHFIQRPKD